jgi:predicted DNA repair protein MutK
MSIGLIALLDDVASLAKAAAASLDDVAGQAAKAGTKAAGVVIDDAAVTPRYVTGLSASRELPIIGKIAMGSFRNKLLFLLPAALALSLVAPQAITPLLMIGGAYLCYEGAEKIYHALLPRAARAHEANVEPVAIDASRLEDRKVASAIKTDFILSAEIMAITLGTVADANLLTQALVLGVVGIGITLAVYGAVALIVKADDAGLALARSQAGPPAGAAIRLIGRLLAHGTTHLLGALGVIGTAAMVWVGGGIILHGLEVYGLGWPSHAIHDMAAFVARLVPAVGSLLGWIVEAAAAGIVGIAIGLIAIPVTTYAVSPLWRQVKAWGQTRRVRLPISASRGRGQRE